MIFDEERPRARGKATRGFLGPPVSVRGSSGIPPRKGEAGMPVAALLVKFYSVFVKF